MRVENKLKKLNNRGMSLVEVLVAMIILSIAGVTFLQSFSSAVQNNTKAKEKQLALTYAQSMMETCKAYSVNELKERHAILDDEGNPTGAYHYNYQVFDCLGSAFSPNLGAEKDPTSPFYGIDEHTFSLNGVNNGKFDVEVQYKPISPTASGAGAKAKTKTTLHNVHNPNSDTDAVFKQNITLEQDKILEDAYGLLLVEAEFRKNSVPEDTRMYDFLTEGIGDYSMLPYSTINITNRQFDVYISNSDVKVHVTYDYSIELAYDYYTEAGARLTDTFSSGGSVSWSTDYTGLFTGTFSELANFYMFYYPLYDGVSGVGDLKTLWMDGADDRIVVHNTSGNHVNAYIVKQKLPAPNAARQLTLDNILKSYESRYKVTLRNDGDVDFYHNVDESLYNSITGGYTTIMSAGHKVYNSLSLQEADETLIYEITVTIDDAEGNELVKLTGTTNAR